MIVTLSTDHQLGRLILFLSEDNSTLPPLVIYGFYENVEANDPFAKEITKLMYSLMTEFTQSTLTDPERERIIQAWKLYMGKIDREAYFEQIADSTIKSLLKQEQTVGGLSKDKKYPITERRTLMTPMEVNNKEQLIS